MKLRLQKDQAKKTIAYILNIVNDSVILLSCTKDKQRVSFEGASAGAYVRVTFPTEVEVTGVVAIDGNQLAGIKFPTDVVYVADSSSLGFISGTLKGRINTLDSGAHVTMQRPQGKLDAYTWVSVPKELITKAMAATVFDASMKSSINGVTLRIEHGKLILHAFDAVRASLYVADIDSKQTVRVVLAGNFFSALKKIPGDNLEMAFDAGSVLVRTESAIIAYPTLQTETQDVLADVTELLQQPHTGVFTVPARRLTDAVTTAASVVRGGLDYDTRVDINVSAKDTGSTLTLTLTSPHGEIVESIALDGEVQPCSFGISGKHVAEMLALLSGDVQIRYYGSTVMFLGDEGRATVVLATMA